jgi:hypothetical protein
MKCTGEERLEMIDFFFFFLFFLRKYEILDSRARLFRESVILWADAARQDPLPLSVSQSKTGIFKRENLIFRGFDIKNAPYRYIKTILRASSSDFHPI